MLPESVRDRVRRSGLATFVTALPDELGHSDKASTFALMERWMCSTHTFQLPCGEYTISPGAFAAITGVSCAGERIPFDGALYFTSEDERTAYFTSVFGHAPTYRDRCTRIVYSGMLEWLAPLIVEGADGRPRYRDPGSEEARDQVASIFLFHLLGSTLFSNETSSLWIHFVPLLGDFDAMGRYDWGSAALAYLYSCMDKFATGYKKLNGFWHAIQVGVVASVCFHVCIFALN